MANREKWSLINFSDHGDMRGRLVAIEAEKDIPFEIKRVFYIFGSDPRVCRGRHANIESEFVLINVAGKCKVKLFDGREENLVELDNPMQGLYIPKLIWKEMFDFSDNAVLLVLASTKFNKNEYINDYEQYKMMTTKQKTR